MNEQKKRQLIKALAYDTNREKIKTIMGVTDEEIDSISLDKIEVEKEYYRKMGYIK